jgi:hypothetical protein
MTSHEYHISPAAKYTLHRRDNVYQNRMGDDHTGIIHVNPARIGRRIIQITLTAAVIGSAWVRFLQEHRTGNVRSIRLSGINWPAIDHENWPARTTLDLWRPRICCPNCPVNGGPLLCLASFLSLYPPWSGQSTRNPRNLVADSSQWRDWTPMAHTRLQVWKRIAEKASPQPKGTSWQ